MASDTSIAVVYLVPRLFWLQFRLINRIVRQNLVSNGKPQQILRGHDYLFSLR